MTKSDFNKKKMTMDDVKIGVVFYIVRGLGKQSYTSRTKILSKPETKATSCDVELGPFCKATTFYITSFSRKKEQYDSDISLRDAGIDPNKYNDHLSFLKEKDAKLYLEWAKTNTTPPNDFPFDYHNYY